MAWIESHQELRTHVKTRRIERVLGISTATVIGHLHMLWWWTIDHTDYGLIPREYEDQDIAEGCGWTGDAKVFVEALKWAGWLDDRGDGWLFVHGWHERCGMMLKRRYKNELRRKESVVEIGDYVRRRVAGEAPPQLALDSPEEDFPGDVDNMSTSGRHPVDIRSTSGRHHVDTNADLVGQPIGETTDHTDHTDHTDRTDQRARARQAHSQPRPENHSDSENGRDAPPPPRPRPRPDDAIFLKITDIRARAAMVKGAQENWDRQYGPGAT